MPPVLGLILSYLLGSVPTAYIAGKICKGIDLRQHGSGNLGATNVYRVLGAPIAALVMAVDVAKGVVPVALLSQWTDDARSAWWPIAFGVAAILGHARSAFLLWKGGGKGVATAAGVFLALAPLPTLVATAVWVIVVCASGYVSLGSLSAAGVLPGAVALLEHTVRSLTFVLSVAVALFVFWTHRANLGRLRRGEEHRFGRKPAA